MDANYLWMFILVGNAVAVFALNAMYSGGTSSMGGRDYTTPNGTRPL